MKRSEMFLLIFFLLPLATATTCVQAQCALDEDVHCIVYLPQEIKDIAQLLDISYEPYHQYLPVTAAYDLIRTIYDCLPCTSDPAVMHMHAYLEQYREYLKKPEVWISVVPEEFNLPDISRRQFQYESTVIFDMWVQHALRANLITVDSYASVAGDLSVGGSTIINKNLTVVDNTTIGQTLTVFGPAHFEEVFIGCIPGCSVCTGCSGGSGVLQVCGEIIINGITVTGPFGPRGATGMQGPTGPIGPIGPRGQTGMLGPTAGSLNLVDITPSTNCTNGTLVVVGGVGIGGDLNVCGYINTFTDYELDSILILNATASNLSVGFNAGLVTNGSNNTLVGNQAGESVITGSDNTFVGYQDGFAISSATDNTLLGAFAGNQLTTGDDNTFLGTVAGEAYAGSNQITCVGSQAGRLVSGGDDTVSLGYQAGYNSASLAQSVMAGSLAGQNAGGNSNVLIGYQAGQNAVGGGNTFIGYQAGKTNGTGFNNTCLGAGADVSIANGLINATAIGAGTIVTGNNQIQLGTSATNVYVSTPGGIGSLFLPTVGGTPTGLNYYEQFTAVATVSYSNPCCLGTMAHVNFYATRIGNKVTLTLDQFGTVGGAGFGPASFTITNGAFTPVLPTRFAPPILASEYISAICAPVTEDSPSAGPRAAGEWQVYGDGSMKIMYFDQVDSASNFPGDEYHSGGQLTISYSIAS